jgi:hypothetical protein
MSNFSLTARKMTRRQCPETSFIAAEALVSSLGELQQQVYDVLDIAQADGFTDLEMHNLCVSKYGHRSYGTYRTRRVELYHLGLVIKTGARRVQEGTARTVWALSKYKSV